MWSGDRDGGQVESHSGYRPDAVVYIALLRQNCRGPCTADDVVQRKSQVHKMRVLEGRADKGKKSLDAIKCIRKARAVLRQKS